MMKLVPTLAALLVALSTGLAVAGENPVTFAERSAAVEITGTITEVDKENRLFRVSDDQGATLFSAGEDIRNFDQIQVGDEIVVEVIRSVAVAMVDPEISGEPTITGLAARADQGAKPGAVKVGVLTLVVEFIAYDPETFVATIKTPKDEVVKLVVKPEIREFAESRKAGDRIGVAMTQAVAVAVKTAN